MPGSSSEFKYVSSPDNELTLTSESVAFSNSIPSTMSVSSSDGGGSGSKRGNKLGNAPEALYRVLQKSLAKGRQPPPHFPVHYMIYTLSDGGVEKFTDVLTKMPR